MRIFTLFIFMLLATVSSIAQTSINFETGGAGAGYIWNVFENSAANPPLEFVANPNPSGINTSAKVAKFIAKLGGQQYAGTETAKGQSPPFTFSVNNSKVKIMVYKTVISNVGLKFAESSGEAQPEVKVANTKINEWEELTFDLSGSIGKGITKIIDQVIVFPDFAARAQDNIIYFDNITFSAQGSGGGGSTEPTAAAPTPTVNAANVISIFSGVYTNVTGTNFNPNWSQSTIVTQVDIAGNNTLKYANLNYQGTQFASGLNVTGMTTLHVDFWTTNSTALNIYLISPGPVEKAYPLPITPNQWVSVDIPLTAFTNPNVNLNNVIQFKVEGNGTIYLDNLYFNTSGSSGTNDYTLVWSDEFSGTGALAADRWFHQTQLPAGGNWYNGEQQHYTNRIENSSTANGFLKIVAKKESFTDQGQTKQYTSARLNSKFAFTYGRVDVRAKLPSGAGTWPAIWMLGKNINEPGGYFSSQFGTTNWPATGEIDIMEHWGNRPNVIHGSIHTTSSSGSTVNTSTKTIPQVSTTFHVYSIIWDETKIQFLIDDIAFYTYNPAIKNASTWPFDKPQYLLLNIAMGGIGGAIDPTFTESAMEVDYVRVYQKGVAPPPPTLPTLPLDFESTTIPYTFTDFDGGAMTVVANPNSGGINTSAKVAKMVKSAGQPWGGSWIGLAAPIDFSSNKLFKAKIYSPRVGARVLLKVENQTTASINFEKEVLTTVANAWQELSFDYSAINTANTYQKITFIFDNGTMGDGSANFTFLVDDIRLTTTGGGAVAAQTITFPAIADKTVGNAAFALTATASSTLAVAYTTVSDKVTISGSNITIVKAGRVIIKANQAGNASFSPAPEVTQTFCIKPAKPTVSITGTNTESVTLTSSAAAGNKWFLNGTAIPSAINATFTATALGIYKVQVTVDDCVSEFSTDAPLIVTGDLANTTNSISAYPNPAENELELRGVKGELSNVELVDLTGRSHSIEFEKNGEFFKANIQHLTHGIYLLQVQEGSLLHRIKLIKK